MTREEQAIEYIKKYRELDEKLYNTAPKGTVSSIATKKCLEFWDMAIQALENIGHLKDRPCSVCEFHKENGCCKWTCVFTDRLFGDMR